MSVFIERNILVLLRPLLSNHVYTIRRGLAKGLKRKGGFAFIPEQIAPKSREEIFLLNLDLKGKTVYDIGGYQGVLTIFFARSVGGTGKVVTYEPNPINYSILTENIRLNNFNNVDVRQMGLGKFHDKLDLVFDPKDPGRSSFRNDYFVKRNFNMEETNKLQIDVDSLDNQINIYNLPKPDFIKIDVEELELDVLVGMKETINKYKPHLFIEMHGNVENAKNVLDILRAHNYDVFHVELNTTVDSSKTQMVKGGDHLYCV